MNSKHRKTLEAIRSKPERGDIAWAAVEALLLGIGCRKLEGEGSRVRFVSPDGVILRIHRPHPKPVLDKGAVKSVRRFLDQMEIEACICNILILQELMLLRPEGEGRQNLLCSFYRSRKGFGLPGGSRADCFLTYDAIEKP